MSGKPAEGYRMEPKLTFKYDREADILYISKRPSKSRKNWGMK